MYKMIQAFLFQEDALLYLEATKCTFLMKQLLLFSLPILLWVIACNSDTNTTESGPDSLSGEKLSRIHCGSCHLFPEPELLDKASWENYMLPRMGYMLGIYPNDSIRSTLIEKGVGGQIVEAANIFPEKAVLSPVQWQKIQDYYLKNSPDEPIAVPAREIAKSGAPFKVVYPNYKLSPPSVTLVNYSKEDKALYVGDANTQTLMVFDQKLNPQNVAKVKEGAVWLNKKADALWLTVMGSFSPTDAPKGFMLTLPTDGKGKVTTPITGLQRPVHSDFADLDGDGLEDIVICEFGKWTGSLSWWKNKGQGQYERKILRDISGAIKAYIKDLNNDGLPDIISLFGQGNEGIWIFYNEGNGNFKEERALQFNPSMGSSFFNLYDFNGDGHLDIVYTNGDNADFKPILKHYHGIRVFLNDGQNKFEETFFFQLNGAYNAVPNDFDGDGDVDIAVISFFPDFKNHPEEGFVYLENTGNFNFEAKSIEQVLDGRWIVMEGADYDQDGDMDLVLGSLAFEVVPPMGLVNQWVEKGIPFIVLENEN